MSKIKVVFTKTNWSIVSFLIRYMLPRSRFTLSLSSHCYIVADNHAEDGEFYYEADPFHGVRIIKKTDAITKHTVIVKELYFTVMDKDKAFEFLDAQLGKSYDFRAAFGLGLDPLRDWNSDDKWYCYELCAAALKEANGPQFNNASLVNESILIAVSD